MAIKFFLTILFFEHLLFKRISNENKFDTIRVVSGHYLGIMRNNLTNISKIIHKF